MYDETGNGIRRTATSHRCFKIHTFIAYSFAGKTREGFPLQMGEIQGQVIAADINDDGKIEMVTTDTRGNVAAWTSQGKEIWEKHLRSLIAQVVFLCHFACS